jgi:5-methylcytosine-specific restriction protein B
MAHEFEEIKVHHILDAIKKIDTGNFKLNGKPTDYDVIINDKPYPPKEVMRCAYEVMKGEPISFGFSGGYEGTNKYLVDLGFKVIDKRKTVVEKELTSRGELKMHSKNVILYGPPGTGKTYNSIDKAVEIASPDTYKKEDHRSNKIQFDELRKQGQIEFITFHQNYTYEDFMIGIRPDVDNSNTLTFKKYTGIFYEIVKRAIENSVRKYVLIIDEINRANISKVFGELITLLEEDKRLGEENELKITLPNGDEFGIPSNLYLIGTMNTADKSIALVDIALRRRFEFIGYYPKYEGLDRFSKSSGTLLKQINTAIFEKKKSADYLIGHAYFMKNQPIESVLLNKVIPLLMEYFSGKIDIVENIFSNTDYTVKYNSSTYFWEVKRK